VTSPERGWRLATEADTLALGARFADAWRTAIVAAGAPPARAWRVALAGELGAGKTTWARGFLLALGEQQSVQSPSYSLVQIYEPRGCTVLHADFYRLGGPADLDALALEDVDRPGVLWLIEWPDRAAGRLGTWDLTLHWTLESNAHAVRVQAGTPAGEQWLSQVLD
jgi:tRNA threonylcarbamoyladenosine biosynthesis protein TsaE